MYKCHVLVNALAYTCLINDVCKSSQGLLLITQLHTLSSRAARDGSVTLGKCLYIDIGENDIVQDVDSVDPV